MRRLRLGMCWSGCSYNRRTSSELSRLRWRNAALLTHFPSRQPHSARAFGAIYGKSAYIALLIAQWCDPHRCGEWTSKRNDHGSGAAKVATRQLLGERQETAFAQANSALIRRGFFAAASCTILLVWSKASAR